MKQRLPIALLLAAAIGSTATAQQLRRCASYEYLQQQLATDPQMKKNLDDLEAQTAVANALATARTANGNQTTAIVTIPVVVHILYFNTGQNISDTRINEQIAVLNEDYRKLNTDISNVPSAWTATAADCEIQFCLAQRDPSGNPTNGILHVPTTHSQFSMTNDSMKYDARGGDDIWDRNKYLNLWVCKLSGGILGYSQFPGGASATDGVVLDYRYVGKTGASYPYNKGRTATHEIGHWLNLKHIWGDDFGSCSGSDNCNDTPNQGSENYGCPTFPHTDNCTGTSPGVMFMNYMDYTDDACMYMFTANQKTRMTTALNGTRASILTSNGCTPVGLGPDEQRLGLNVSLYPSPTTGAFTISLGYLSLNEVDVTVYNMIGAKVIERHITDIDDQRVNLDLTGDAPGMYFVELRANNERVIRKLMLSAGH